MVNSLGYAAYLLLVALGLSPRTAVSVLLPGSMFAAFRSHVRFTFGVGLRDWRTATRCVVVTLFGYVVNLTLLTSLSERLDFAHQVAQFLALAAIVPTMFVNGR